MEIIILNSSKEPIYEQITKQIKKYIFYGDLKEGDLLPSIRNLAKEIGISVITTKRAYEELEKGGFIETVPGKGSYVTAQNKQLFIEKRMKIIEDKLIEVIEESKYINLEVEDLKEILQVLYENTK